MTSKRSDAIDIIGSTFVENSPKMLKDYKGGSLIIRYEKDEPCKKGDLLITGIDCQVVGEIFEEF
jgi:hypothetical protein